MNATPPIRRSVVAIGEQKSGSTLLAVLVRRLLYDGPAGKFPNATRKELHVMDRWHGCVSGTTAWDCQHEMARYLTAYGWYVDATPGYFSSINALIQLRASLPPAEPRLLLIIREPAARAQSAWLHNRDVINVPDAELRSFDTAIHEELAALHERCFDSTLVAHRVVIAARRVASSLVPWEETSSLSHKQGSFDEVLRAYPSLEAMDQRVVSTMNSTRCRPTPRFCWLQPVVAQHPDCKMYLSRGLQAEKLRNWRSRFPHLLVLRTEEVATRDVAETATRLAHHIGVPEPQQATLTFFREAIRREHWHRHASRENASSADVSAATAQLLQAFYERDQQELDALVPRL